jgi:hypothetical protein
VRGPETRTVEVGAYSARFDIGRALGITRGGHKYRGLHGREGIDDLFAQGEVRDKAGETAYFSATAEKRYIAGRENQPDGYVIETDAPGDRFESSGNLAKSYMKPKTPLALDEVSRIYRVRRLDRQGRTATFEKEIMYDRDAGIDEFNSPSKSAGRAPLVWISAAEAEAEAMAVEARKKFLEQEKPSSKPLERQAKDVAPRPIASSAEQVKAGDKPVRTVTLNVDGEERSAQLTQDQARRWDEAEERHKERIDFFKRGHINSGHRDLLAKQLKGEGIRYAAEKREIAGQLTAKERAAAAKREASNYIGKEVTVNGKPATVEGVAFGKVKVKFEGGKTRTVTPGEIGAAATVPEGFRESERGALTLRRGTALDFGGLDHFRSPLSNLELVGGYERRGGKIGRMASDLIRQAQIDISTGTLTKAAALKQLARDTKPIIDHFKANGKPGLAAQLKRHVFNLRGSDEPFENVSNLLKSIQYNTKLRFNIKSRIINELQPLATLWPHVSTKEFLELSAKARMPSTYKRLDALGGFSTGSKAGAAPAKSSIPDFFGKASDYNRAMGYMHGETDAARLGLTGSAAHRHAMDWAKRVEFDSSKWDAPPILNGPVASVLGQFKGFTIKNIESIANDLKLHQGDIVGGYAARAGKRILSQIAIGGVRSILGVKQIGGLLIVGAVAKALSKTGMDEDEANKAAEALYYGAPSLIGEDLSGSSMILDEPYGNNAYERIVNFLGGPTLSMGAKLATEAQNAYKARTPEDRLEAGKRAAAAVTPYYRMGESAVKAATGDSKVNAASKDVELNRFEMIMRAMGFTPVKQTKAYDERDAAKESSAAMKLAKEIQQAKAPAGGLNVEQREKAKKRRTYEEEIRKGGAIPQDLKDELGKGNITGEQFVDMLKRGKKTELENTFDDLSFKDSLDVYEVATPEEKKKLKLMLYLKLKSLSQLPATDQKKVLDRFREVIK